MSDTVPVHDLANVGERYRFLVKLGSGGMADIFLGVQHGVENFKRLIVIKRVHAGSSADEATMQMFVDEAQTVASLNHPHIVKIFDLSRLGQDICITMEYIDGENLDYLREGVELLGQTIPVSIVCKLMVEAAEALDYVHAAQTRDGKALNLVHRDIGPQNLLIDGNGYLKIIDFGVAKSEIHSEDTSSGILRGKSSYMAPDVFRHADIDGRADIYALGLVFFELLTLRRAFPFAKDAAVSDIIQCINNQPLPSVAGSISGPHEAVDALLAKATAKDRRQRYVRGADMASAIIDYAASVGGLASNSDVQRWFQETFRKRILERRDLERRAMLKAAQPPGAPPKDGSRRLKTGQTAIFTQPSAGVRTGSNTATGTDDAAALAYIARGAKRPYFLAAAVVVSLLGAGFMGKLLFSASPPVQVLNREVNVTGLSNNLLVLSSPAGADVFVDSHMQGNTHSSGLHLRIEPNRVHVLEVRLEGYEPYVLSVPGDPFGQRRITVDLLPVARDKRIARRKRGKRRRRFRRHTKTESVVVRPLDFNGQPLIVAAADSDDDFNGNPDDADDLDGQSAAPEERPSAVPVVAADVVQKRPQPTPNPMPTAKAVPPDGPVFQSMSEALHRRIAGETPLYPEIARERGIQSAVVMKISVDRTGRVIESTMVEGDRVFRRPVARALKKWRFKPYIIAGEPVETYALLRFYFKLDE